MRYLWGGVYASDMGGKEPEGPNKTIENKEEAAVGRVDGEGGEVLHIGIGDRVMEAIAFAFMRMYVWLYDAIFPPRILQEWTDTKPNHPDVQVISYRASGGHWLWAGPVGAFRLPAATTRVPHGTPGSVCSARVSMATQDSTEKDVSGLIKQHAGPSGCWDEHISTRAFLAILTSAGKIPTALMRSLEIEFYQDKHDGDINSVWQVIPLHYSK